MPPLQRLRPTLATPHLLAIPARPRRRAFASSRALCEKPTKTSTGLAIPPPLQPRWIAALKDRIGKCIAFGCDGQQVARAADVLRVLAQEWRQLLVGSEGFLTGGRRGIEGQVCHCAGAVASLCLLG
ncbi:hypothetical protein QBC39DRAFT_129890 [Podospora conica]|nr:hypothetical protein QBC39DRAFT_129890 [Schizothecium conicum]